VLMPIEIDPLYVAPAGMSAIAKHLAQDFLAAAPEPPLLLNHRALAISYLSDHWKIECNQGAVVLARRCAIAIPAPQAADLLNTCEANHPQLATLSRAIAHLQAVQYHACLTVLAGYDSSCLNQMAPIDADGWMVTDRVGTSTDWIGLDSSKRDRADGQTPRPVVVIHSKPAFALRYLEAGDLQPGASVLLRANARKIGEWIAQPEWFKIHRWRYAQVKVAHPEAALTMGQSLVCGGDWCIPPGQVEQSIDSAYRSGLAMAQVLMS
jgi:renalase